MPRYTVKHAAYALRKLRIDLREAGFIGPIVALVPSLRKFDYSIVNTIDGGYGRGYDGYLEELLEPGRFTTLIQYYCHARSTFDHGVAIREILYSPLVINHPPRMVLLPVDQRESSAFADANMIPYSIHEAEVARALSLTLDYGIETRLLLDVLGLIGPRASFHDFVVPTQAFREADQSKIGWQMVHLKKRKRPDEVMFESPEATLSVIRHSGVQLDRRRILESPNVILAFHSKLSSPTKVTIEFSSKRMSECQVSSLEISRICIRRIIEHYARTETSGFNKFFTGEDVSGHGARYLITGYRSYLDPEFTRIFWDRAERGSTWYPKEGGPTEVYIVGDKVAAMQLCEIRIEINNVILPSEVDIDFRKFRPKDLDSLQVHVGKPNGTFYGDR